MKKHHKIILGSVGLLLILIIGGSSIFMYKSYTKLNANYLELMGKVTDTQTELKNLENNLNSFYLNLNSTNENITYLENSNDFSEIIDNTIKSVVMIKTDVSQGSGFFIAENYIITNCHITIPAHYSSIYITTYDGKTYLASRWGDNSKMDICLLKVENVTYASLKFGNSDEVQLGEKTIAIGNPLGLEFSVTQGIVSAVNKKRKDSLGSYIQTDTALNPGNSGGPLIDMEGKVIGINNFKIAGGENLGFALESNYIKDIVNEISLERNGYKLI